MIIGNLSRSFRRLCFYFSILAPLYVLNASNSAVTDHVDKLYRSVHVKNTEELHSFHFDEEEPKKLSAFYSHSWPTVPKLENGKLVHVEVGNQMLFNDQIVESGNVFNHMEKYTDTEEFFKLEDRYSILNVLLGDDLAKLYIRLKRNEEANYYDKEHYDEKHYEEELKSLAGLYYEKLLLLDPGKHGVTGSTFYKDDTEFFEALKDCSDHYLKTKSRILSDLELIVLHLKDIYSTKMHRLYTELVDIKNAGNMELVDIKNAGNDPRKTEPFKIWKVTSGKGEDSSTHTEVLVIYKILSGISSSESTDKKLIDLPPSEWTDKDKQQIANALPSVLFSRKAMCDTCETFMSCLFSYIFDKSATPRSGYHTVFVYSIGGMSSEHDTNSKLAECHKDVYNRLRSKEASNSQSGKFVPGKKRGDSNHGSGNKKGGGNMQNKDHFFDGRTVTSSAGGNNSNALYARSGNKRTWDANFPRRGSFWDGRQVASSAWRDSSDEQYGGSDNLKNRSKRRKYGQQYDTK